MYVTHRPSLFQNDTFPLSQNGVYWLHFFTIFSVQFLFLKVLVAFAVLFFSLLIKSFLYIRMSARVLVFFFFLFACSFLSICFLILCWEFGDTYYFLQASVFVPLLSLATLFLAKIC